MSDRYQTIEVQGNNGKSFVQMTAMNGNMVHLYVVESSVVRIDQKISVSALAAILTAACDAGLQRVVNGYLASYDRKLTVSVESDKHLMIEQVLA